MWSVVRKQYPRATQNRLRFGEHGWGKGRAFLGDVAKNFSLLQLLFFALFAYTFGALFQQNSNAHNLGIVFIDYDEGPIGEAIRAAYRTLQGDTFPTLIERPATDFPTPSDLQSSVCSTDYWAALYVSDGASARLRDALAGGPPAQAYDRKKVLTFIWNEARYPVTIDGLIASNLQTLSAAARVAYTTGNGTGNISAVTTSEALSVLVSPWELSSVNIRPTTQGSRAIYNTLVIILILIQEFFYLGTINGIYAGYKVYTRIHPARIILVRNLNSLAYTLVGSLCTVGAIFAFRAGWDVGATQFGLSWMALWLFAHLNFLTLDVFTIWLPHPYVAMALITWVILNVTSILLPFELSSGFYRVGYAMPAHEIYQILVDIWSRGCNPRLHVALPVLFAWELVSFVLSALGVFRRSHYAEVEQERAAAQFQERLDTAVEFQRSRDQSRPGVADDEKITEVPGLGEGGAAKETEEEGEVRRKLAEVISKEDKKASRNQRRASQTCGFGPAFAMPFTQLDRTDSEESGEINSGLTPWWTR